MSKTKVILFKIIPIIIIFIIGVTTNVLGFENFDANILQNLQTGTENIESANTAVGKTWNTIVMILQVLAVAAVVIAGVRYMFQSADGKADIKKQSIGLLVGTILVFGSSLIIDFVVDVTEEITVGGTNVSVNGNTNQNISGNINNNNNNNNNNTENGSEIDNEAKEIPVTDIKIETTLKIKEGETTKLTPVIVPENATNVKISYLSNNNKVITIDADGNVNAISKGTAKIGIKAGNITKKVKVIVEPKEILVEEINIAQKEIGIKVGENYKIDATVKPSNAENKKLTYLSSNTNVVNVTDNGKIIGKNAGNATVTVKSESGNVSTEVHIKVEESHRIHFIKTSTNSDCILLESNGKYALIDTARSKDYGAIKEYLNNLNVTKLEFIMLTHNHLDHVGSAKKLIGKYKPNKLYLKRYHGNDTDGSAGEYNEKTVEANMKRYNEYIDKAKEVKTEIIYIDDYSDGYTINLNKMEIKNYNVKNLLTDGAKYARKMSENGNAFTSLVTVNGLKTYLASDLTYDRYADPIAEMIGKVDVHKVGHHGIHNGTSVKEANALKPDYAIITNTEAKLNTYDVNAIDRVKTHTKENKIYFSCENTIIVDYTTGKVQITELK